MGSDDAQRDATGGQFGMQLMQHLRAGKIEIGRMPGDRSPPAGCRTEAPKPVQDSLQDSVSIDVNQRCFGPKGEYAEQRLVFGMAGEIGAHRALRAACGMGGISQPSGSMPFQEDVVVAFLLT